MKTIVGCFDGISFTKFNTSHMLTVFSWSAMMSLLNQTLLLYFEILQVFLFRPFIFDECFCFVDAKNKNLNKAKLCQVPGRPRRRLASASFARQNLKAFVPTLSCFKISDACEHSVTKIFFKCKS